VTDPIILARIVHIAATVLAAGTVSFMVLVAEPAFERLRSRALDTLRRRCNAVVWWALGVAILSGAAWLALLAADIYGAPLADVCLQGGLWSVLTNTRFGTVWMARLALALLLALLLLRPALRWLQLAAVAALIALLALIGHAGAMPGPAGELHLASDLVHLIAAGAWLGGLPALAMLLSLPRLTNGIAARAAERFSVLGIAAVAAILASGIVNSWMLLGSSGDLLTTEYGRLLSLKIGLFLSMLGVAVVNKFYLTPQLAKSGARAALKRNSLAETALGAGIVVLVAMLGTLSPTAHHHLPTADVPVNAAFTHIHSEEGMAEVTIEPGHTGRANASIRVMHEDSSQFLTDRVRLMLDPPAPGSQPVSRAAVRQPDGTWQVDGISLPQPGNWTVRVIFTGDKGHQIVLDAPLVIAPAP
jgi:putative copper resistance protein D